MKAFTHMLLLAFVLLLIPTRVPQASQVVHSLPKQELPAGFIAMSDDYMTWRDAVAYCQRQGGRLPLVSGRKQWDGENSSIGKISIDGFGKEGSPWPSGLPATSFWTGTHHSAVDPSSSWFVYVRNGKAYVTHDIQDFDYRVVCIQ